MVMRILEATAAISFLAQPISATAIFARFVLLDLLRIDSALFNLVSVACIFHEIFRRLAALSLSAKLLLLPVCFRQPA